MNRLLDKLIVLLCCLTAASLMPLTTATVVSAVSAVACAGAGEVVAEAPWARSAQAGLWLAWVAASLAVPEAGAFLPLALYEAARAPRGGHAAAAGAGALGLAVVCGRMGQLGVGLGAVLFVALFSLLACLLSVRSGQAERMRRDNRRIRDALQERSLLLEAKNRDLLERQDYEVELATLAERARIAREIHDNVGHQLTRAKLQADALSVVHAGDKDVAAAFLGVGETIEEALQLVRASVHALREDSVDLAAQMRKAVDAVAADSGVTVMLDVSTENPPANVASCFVAVTRESVSNALRHAHGMTKVEVRCLEHPSLWQLVIKNDGQAAGGAAARAGEAAGPAACGGFPGKAVTEVREGMGISSMRERITALGGSFSAGPLEDGGWRVFASVPKPAAPAGGATATGGALQLGRAAGGTVPANNEAQLGRTATHVTSYTEGRASG